MPLDIKELEDYVRKMENRYKENSLLIEKRFAELEQKMQAQPARPVARAASPVQRPAAGEEPVIVEGSEIKTMDDVRDRIQELEDLLLLIELENTKLREGLAQGGGTEITPAVSPDINERLSRLEEQMSSMHPETAAGDLSEKIRELENKVQRLETAPRVVTRAEKTAATRKPGHEEESSILEEVHMILGR